MDNPVPHELDTSDGGTQEGSGSARLEERVQARRWDSRQIRCLGTRKRDGEGKVEYRSPWAHTAKKSL